MTTPAHPAGTWIAPATGSLVAHDTLLARLAQQQVVLLGETHDRFDIHRWQLHICAGLLAHRPDIAVGFKMFPRRSKRRGTFVSFFSAVAVLDCVRIDPVGPSTEI